MAISIIDVLNPDNEPEEYDTEKENATPEEEMAYPIPVPQLEEVEYVKSTSSKPSEPYNYSNSMFLWLHMSVG